MNKMNKKKKKKRQEQYISTHTLRKRTCHLASVRETNRRNLRIIVPFSEALRNTAFYTRRFTRSIRA